MTRTIPVESPLRCGICRRPVLLLRAGEFAWLVEDLDGDKIPHACPEAAVEAWDRARRIRRLAARCRPREEGRS